MRVGMELGSQEQLEGTHFVLGAGELGDFFCLVMMKVSTKKNRNRLVRSTRRDRFGTGFGVRL